MELIERAGFLVLLEKQFSSAGQGEGHCIFVSGEAGIGKTSLVKTFCNQLKKEYNIYTGTCDALFTPRPLAPLYDILLQVNSDLREKNTGVADRTELFSNFFHELSKQKKAFVIVFEDIHWADEATIDFIKFLARRITQIKCLFILTYRDNEIYHQHPLRNVLAQLPADSFTRIKLPALSMQAVEKLAVDKGYNAAEIYKISGGNPFYVNEILASYSPGVPDNIKDSVLSVYNLLDEKTKQLLELLSILPTGIEVKYLEKIEPLYETAFKNCFNYRILIPEAGLIFFKHELYRKTIELSLSPLLRVMLNKKIINLFRESFEQNGEIERLIHHAKNANEYDLVVQHAPVAAKAAALLGAHIEASKLYLTTIEYYQGKEKDLLIELYEAYAYECYLTNQTKQAIIYTGKALQLWKEKNETEKIGNSLRFLSRLWWYEGNRKNAETFAEQAIETLDKQPSSRAKAMAFSNMSQLNMLSKETEKSIYWGEKAITIAKELADEETLSHALNNVGTVQMEDASTKEKGMALLQQSLQIALQYGYHEHAARAYTNLCSIAVVLKDYAFAEKALDEGILFCEERDLDTWSAYMLSFKARLKLETGYWKEAYSIADNLLKNESQPSVVKINVLAVMATLKLRKADEDALPLLLELKTKALETKELQRIVPALVACLEYEWITGKTIIETEAIDVTISLIAQTDHFYEASEFAFWLRKTRKHELSLKTIYEGYDTCNKTKALKAVALWKQLVCPYEQALALFEGDEENKKEAIGIMHELGAAAVYEKMKQEMRTAGIKSIPRGMRKSTQQNAAQLTNRELDVLQLLKEGLQNKEIGAKLFISPKTVDHHISSLLFKLGVNSRIKAVQEALRLEIIK